MLSLPRYRSLWILTAIAMLGAIGWSARFALAGDLTGTTLPPNVQVIHVTNLQATGPGSLQDALSATGPRVVVFDVGGVIDLRRPHAANELLDLQIHNPNIVVAGETAPAPGITIIGGGIIIDASDVIVRHLRVRVGKDANAMTGVVSNALKIHGTKSKPIRHLLIDHNSFSWSVDENSHLWINPKDYAQGAISDVILRRNIFSEGLFCGCQKDACSLPGNEGLGDLCHPDDKTKSFPIQHSHGTLLANGSQHIIFDRNLYANNDRRNPWTSSDTTALFVNNLIYNPRQTVFEVSGCPFNIPDPQPGPEMTMIGNVAIPGPDTKPEILGTQDTSIIPGEGRLVWVNNPGPGCMPLSTRIYQRDNWLVGHGKDWAVSTDLTNNPDLRAGAPLATWTDIAALHPNAAEDVETDVMGDVGARPWDLDPQDTRLKNNVHNRNTTGRQKSDPRIMNNFATSQNDLCGFNQQTGKYDLCGYPSFAMSTRTYDPSTLLPIPEEYLQESTGGSTGGTGGTGGTTGGDPTLVGSWQMENATIPGSATVGPSLFARGPVAIVQEDGEGVANFDASQNAFMDSNTAPAGMKLTGPATSFAISAWFKPVTASENPGILRGIAAKTRSGRFAESRFQVYAEGGKVHFTIGDSSDLGDVLTSDAVISDQSWNHVAAWYDLGTDNLYMSVNGEPPVHVPATNTNSFATADDQGLFFIGSLFNYARFNGSIDDVRVWKRSLTVDEASSLFTSSAHHPGGATSPPIDTGGGSLPPDDTGDTQPIGGDGFEPPSLSDRLMGSWQMDGASFGDDSSDAHNPLGMIGTLTKSFDDGDTAAVFPATLNAYLQAPPTASLNVDGSSFTVSVWFNPGSVPSGTGDLHGIVAKTKDGAFGKSPFQLYHENGIVRFTIGDNTPTPDPNDPPTKTLADIVTSPTQATEGVWTHAVAWYDAGADTISISVNGEAPVTVGTPNTLGFQSFTDKGNFLIGTLNAYAGFEGKIDDVRYWKRTLTPDERTWLFTSSPHNHSAVGGGNGQQPGASDVMIFDNADDTGPMILPFFRLYSGLGYRGSIRYFSAKAAAVHIDPFGELFVADDSHGIQPNTTYEVFMTWPANPAFTKDVPFRSLASANQTDFNVTIDETIPPRADLIYDGVPWQKLGEYVIETSQLMVFQILPLGTSLNQESYTVMDAILIRKK